MIKGYITNLGKYNAGELIGEWIEFPISEEELAEVFERIGINEEYEEYFFTDWEYEATVDLGEYENVSYVNKIAEQLEEWGDVNKLNACLELWGLEEVLDAGEDNFWFYPEVETDYDLGYYLIEESGEFNTSGLGVLCRYIDYEAYGRDVRFETDGGFSEFGWIQRI